MQVSKLYAKNLISLKTNIITKVRTIVTELWSKVSIFTHTDIQILPK